MRFSTMAILALSAHWATAARINGVIGEELEYQLTKNRELNPKGAKKASKKPPSCGVSGTSSKSSKKSTSDDDSCDTLTSVLTCGETYTGTVTLTTGLVCSDAKSGKFFGIIMDGLDAVLDCAGNDVVVAANDGDDAAIVLRNGATAMNCQVHSGKGSAGVGVLMDVGPATLIDSDIYKKGTGVIIKGDGCTTLTNVRTSDNGTNGVFIQDAAGTIVMTNLEANGNPRNGVNVEVDGDLDLVMDGAKLNSNGFGLAVFGNGNVDVELFGTVRAIGNEVHGILMTDSSSLTVNGTLQTSSNTVYGIVLGGDESELVIAESGTVIACGNGEDIDGSVDQITAQKGSTLIYGVDDCAELAPPNQAAAECKLE